MATMTPEQRDQLNQLLSMATIASKGGRGYIDGQYDPNMTALMNGGESAPLQQPEPPLPENYIRNETTGRVIDMGPSINTPRQGARVPDYSQPVGMDGNQGWMVKGDPTRFIMKDGTIVRINPPQPTTEDLRRKQQELQVQKLQQEVSGGNSEYDKWMARGRAEAALSQVPGTRQYAASQKEAAKEAAALEKTRKTGQYVSEEARGALGALADIVGVTPDQLGTSLSTPEGIEKAKSRVAPAAGVLDSITPSWASLEASQKSDVRSHVNRLKEIAQKTGVVQLRAAGVAPGSITEREWSKFERAVGNLDLSQSEESLVKQLGDAYKYLNNVASSNTAPQPTEGSSDGAMKQINGVTYVKRGTQWFAL